jgi:hypothetical protein
LARHILREIFVALALLTVGLLALPAMVFAVGQTIVGDYESGLAGLYQAIADALATGEPYALLMVLSPYLCVQLFRFWLCLRRQRPTVNQVTD